MSRSFERAASRRGFLRTSGTVAAMIPLVNLVGCSDDRSASAPAEPQPATAPAQPASESAPDRPAPSEPAPASAQNLVKLEESDPQAQALGYRHDASTVDAASYPRHEAGQQCQNCSLYQAGQGSEEGWGGCSIFPGKLVAAGGWCSAYVPAA